MKSLKSSLLALLVISLSPQAALRGADRVSEAIDQGIAYLLPETEKYLVELEGKFKGVPPANNETGRLALQVYALVVAGVAVENPTMLRAFHFMNRMELNHTYTVACYTFALDAAIAQIEDDLLMLEPQKVQEQFRDNPAVGEVFRPRLTAAVTAIVKAQNAKGVWRYNAGAQDFDNSNVQFAVLTLGVGAKRHVPMEKDVWLKVVQHFVKGQQKKGEETKDRIKLSPESEWNRKRDDVKVIAKDGARKPAASGKESPGEGDGKGGDKRGETTVVGKPSVENPEIGAEDIKVFQRGWDYENKGGGNWNMTCAGLSSLLLARDNLRGQIAGEPKEALDKAIRDGYGHLMGSWAFEGNYYGMYSLEKVADIGHVKRFGAHDWYKEVSEHLVGAQQGNGSWPQGGAEWAPSPVSTSFALLILNRATSLLTMNQTSRIMVSGRTSTGEDPNDRSWVYVPELNTTIHYPSLLRAIRLRPSPKLLRFLQNIVENYPDERKGELIPELAAVRKDLPSKSAQKFIDDYLSEITGSKYKEYDAYMKWYRRWLQVVEIGTKQKKERVPDLLKYYQHTNQSVPLKKTVMWALQQLKAHEALPLFLEDLNDPEPAVRLAAYNTFKGFFIDYPPAFNATGAPGEREAQVKAVKEWYAKQQAK